MEELIPISYINDFTFCPASIYFHGLIDGSDKMLYQSKYQIIGKSINLNQFKEEHFNIVDDRYLLDIRYNKEYVKTLIKPILESRMEIFAYFQSFYRSFMKKADIETFPNYIMESR